MSADRDPRVWSMVSELAGGGAVALQHVCAAVAPATGVDGVVAAWATSATVRETVYAADEIAAGLEELTLTLGEGPGVDAVHNGKPVLAADMAGAESLSQWPVFAPAAVALGALAVFALPLRIGAIRLGLLMLYRRLAGGLTRAQVSDGLALADMACVLLLDRISPAAGHTTPGSSGQQDGAWHPEVHQATGMIIVQLGVSAEIAFARLRAHAFAYNRRLGDVAQDVVARRLRFNPEKGDDYADGH
jgi:hypothetical protein